MSEEVIKAIAKKDADFLEKLVRKVLSLATAHWAKKTNDAYKRGLAGEQEYYAHFDEWHRLRLHELAVEDEIAAKRDRNQDPEEAL